MQLNAQIAAAILGFVAAAGAMDHHQHGHLHRRQVVQESPDGEVGVPVNPSQQSRPASRSASGSQPWVTQTVMQTTVATATAQQSQSQAQKSQSQAQQSQSKASGASSGAQQTQPRASSASSVAQQSFGSSQSQGGSATTLHTTQKTAQGGTQTASGPEQTTGDMTINIENKMGTPLSMVYGNNAGGPGAVGSPSNGMIASSTKVVYPTGWAGRITIGKSDDPAGSKIEGSYTGMPNIDVSYVDGYTVPIVCSCANKPVSGCNIDLFSTGRQCPEKQGDTCINTISGPQPNGPAQSFFQPCQGAAYTYPNDNDADEGCQSTVMDCCIGTSCPTVARQPMKNNGSS